MHVIRISHSLPTDTSSAKKYEERLLKYSPQWVLFSGLHQPKDWPTPRCSGTAPDEKGGCFMGHRMASLCSGANSLLFGLPFTPYGTKNDSEVDALYYTRLLTSSNQSFSGSNRCLGHLPSSGLYLENKPDRNFARLHRRLWHVSFHF